MTTRLSRNALLVKYFAQAYQGVPRTKLVKYIYMADVLGREYLGRPLSSFTYRRDKHGPYDPAIEDAVNELLGAGLADEREERYEFPKFGKYKRLVDLHQPVAFDFDIAEAAILEYVVRNYLSMELQELLNEVVYETPPMKAGRRLGELLPMGSLDNAGTRRVGFNLPEVLKAEEAAKRGEVVTLSAFMDELRAATPA